VSSVAGWAFGFAVTILLIALWGRAVVVDTEALGESLSPLAESQTVVDIFTDWMTEEMLDAGVDPVLVAPTIDDFLESSKAAGTMELFVSEVIEAAASSDPADSSVDMEALLTPTIPEVSAGLTAAGIPISETVVTSIVDDLSPLVIREAGAVPWVGPDSPAASRLGTAAALAGVAMLVFGYMVVVVSADRVAAVRGLFTRVAVGGFSFAILLQVGSWVLDPNGGRAPVANTLSSLAGSNVVVPLLVGLGAAVVGGGIYLARRVLRRVAASRSAIAQATRPEDLLPSLSGSR